jgi:hypothetical protein
VVLALAGLQVWVQSDDKTIEAVPKVLEAEAKEMQQMRDSIDNGDYANALKLYQVLSFAAIDAQLLYAAPSHWVCTISGKGLYLLSPYDSIDNGDCANALKLYQVQSRSVYFGRYSGIEEVYRTEPFEGRKSDTRLYLLSPYD